MMRKLATGTVAVLAVALAACTNSPTVSPTTTTRPLNVNVISTTAVDTEATPTGWVPVAFGDAQVSVPISFFVWYPGMNPCELSFSKPNSLFLGPGAAAYRACVGPTEIAFGPADLGSQSSRESPVRLHGIQMYALRLKGVLRYYVPSLGVEVTAVGPLARRILDTLTRSPRAVVLASGPEPVVPSYWNRLIYQGLAFAAPRSWPVIRTTQNMGIGHCSNTGAIFYGPNVILSTDNGIAVFRCVDPEPTPQLPQDGVQVDVGTRTLSQLAEQGLRLVFSEHCLKVNGLKACPATSPAYSILVLKVTVPGRSKPVYVSIGLAGNGMAARTILYSLRAA
jgi:hypothetical protein